MHAINRDKVVERYGEERLGLIEFYRTVALNADETPHYVTQEFGDSPLVRQKLIADFERNKEDPESNFKRVLVSESLAYGDAGALLSTPSPSLSGALIDEIGSEEQKRYYKETVMARNCRTFFCVTEPKKGSDAASMESRLSDGKLNLEKILVGNVSVGEVGTVLFRTDAKFLDMRAAILTPEQINSVKVKRTALDMFGLKACNVGYIKIEDLEIDESQILGQHLSAMEQGIMSMIKVFNRFRPSVSSMAVGMAQALVDHVEDRYALEISQVRALNLMSQEIDIARRLNQDAARQVDKDAFDSTAASLAKIKCCLVARKTANVLGEILPVEAVLFDPWISKMFRDIYAFEWMEGTSNIHRNNVINAMKRNKFDFIR